MDTIEIGEAVTTDKGTYRVRLEQDDTPESPRDFDSNAGIIVAQSHRYHLPQEGDHVADILEWIDNGEEFPEIAYRLRWIADATVVLPIYSMHDGVLHVGDANDNGEHLAGVIYDDSTVTREERAVDPTWNPEQALRVDIEEYNRLVRSTATSWSDRSPRVTTVDVKRGGSRRNLSGDTSARTTQSRARRKHYRATSPTITRKADAHRVYSTAADRYAATT